MKKIPGLLLALTLISIACFGCEGAPVGAVGNTTTGTSSITSGTVSVDYDNADMDAGSESTGITCITLNGDSVSLDGTGAKVDSSIVTIMYARTYSISGTLNDGQIIVNTQDEEKVQLILNGVNITCSTSAPVYVVNAEKTVITLAEGTKNYITDGDSYILEDASSDEPNAAVFSNDDLTINGTGSLTVNANYTNGIQSKDDLKITGGDIVVNAENDAIKGRNSVAVRNGTVTINAGGDGLQSNNNEDAEEGYVAIEGGTVVITAGADGIQAETSLLISGGNLTITTGGGSINSSTGSAWGSWGGGNNATTASSAKALKAGADLTITGGTININSSDDSIHSNGNMVISGGNIIVSSGDDGIHANTAIEINGGDITITKSYEGIESAVVTINNGNIHLVSSDDGINVVGGVDGSAINGRPGQNEFRSSGANYLTIYGGYLYIEAEGDGLDINGPITMTAGKVIINGPTRDDNGALDYTGSFNVTGGYILAVGSSGMAQAPSMSSTQYAVMLNLTSAQQAKTMLHIQTENGEDILTFVPTKTYQSVVLCSPELKKGMTYVVYSGGSSTGTVTDGLYSSGKYTAGTQYTSLTISNILTTVGSPGGPGVGFPGGRIR
jgi:hypothetical protein